MVAVTAEAPSVRTAEGVEVRVLRTPEAVGEARPLWTPLQRHPNADIDWVLNEVAESRGALAPWALLALRDGRPLGLLVGRLETIRLDLRFGYLGLARPEVKALSFIAGCVPDDLDAAASEAVFTALLDALRSGEARMLRLFNLPLDSCLYRLARSRPRWAQRDLAVRRVPHWKILLPETGDAFLRRLKEKHRRPLRQACRALEAPDRAGLRYRLFTSPEEVGAFCDIAESITRKSYLRGIGAGFADSPRMRARLAYAAGRGEWRALALYAGDAPCAFWTGTLYQDTFHAEYTGRDPAFARHNPGTGTVSFVKLIELLCERDHAKVLDFGIGDYAYKERFGDITRDEATVAVLAPGLRGFTLGCVRNGLACAEAAARTALDALGGRERVKRLWRDRLAGARPPRPAATDDRRQ